MERGDPEVRGPVLGVRRTLRPARRPLPRPTLHGRIQVDHHVDHYLLNSFAFLHYIFL